MTARVPNLIRSVKDRRRHLSNRQPGFALEDHFIRGVNVFPSQIAVLIFRFDDVPSAIAVLKREGLCVIDGTELCAM
jgi:hypothetical protein